MMGEAGVVVRRLAASDIEVARGIEERAYTQPWPENGLRQEFEDNRLARYIALETAEGLQGFAGMWCIIDEAHIITVAVDPPVQGRGYGRALVHGLLVLACREGMDAVTLEVRPSNAPARAIYAGYGFVEAGRRVGYYADGEDALILTAEDMQSPGVELQIEAMGGDVERRLPGVRFDLPPGPGDCLS